jgi:SAM-dependent methyltransferase
MPKPATPSGIHEWIARTCRVSRSDAGTLRYARMESQANFSLPEIHRPLDHLNPGHWRHRGLIWDFVLSLEGAERVLDIGPGDGWPSLLLAKHFKQVVGIEPVAERVGACRANAQRLRVRKAQFQQMSATRMEFPDESFDGAVAATSIEQTPSPTAALKEIFRVLRPGGRLRMVYEALEEEAEPVREVAAVHHGQDGTYLIDYEVTRPPEAEQRGFLLTARPLSEANRRQLEAWATRCRGDAFPHRDPRLERGLAETIKGLKVPEILKAEGFRLQHFKTRRLLQTLRRIGFTDIRLIPGGGWAAEQCGEEMIRARRAAAAAPLMEEICRAAARIGISAATTRPGNVIAHKPAARARRRRA